MSIAQQIATDAAARIEQADQEAHDASAAFVAGRFDEYWRLKAEAVKKRLEAEGEQAIANGRDR